MARFEQIGRRTWFGRMAGGFVAIWAGLNVGRGESWAAWLGGAPRKALAQDQRAETIPIQVELTFQGTTFPVAAFLVVRGREVTVVDTLVEGNGDRIGTMIQQAGLDWRAVRHVILTHHHPDHAGSAADIAERASQATIWAGESDIPSITLPRPVHPAYDGDEIFGLRILETPGHTAGHISVLDPMASTLLTGDAMFNLGQLSLSPPGLTTDMAQAVASVQKLAGLSFEKALFAHGAPIESGASAEVAKLAAAASTTTDLQALVDWRHDCTLHV